MRHAFGLPQALLIILFIGGIITVTMRYAGIGAKHYADSYTREQAELFLHSAAEAALLQIGAFERNATGNGECLSDLNITSSDGRFKAVITIERYYMSEGECKNGSGTLISTPIAVSSPFDKPATMVSMQVVVTSDTAPGERAVRLERRSLQRP